MRAHLFSPSFISFIPCPLEARSIRNYRTLSTFFQRDDNNLGLEILCILVTQYQVPGTSTVTVGTYIIVKIVKK